MNELPWAVVRVVLAGLGLGALCLAVVAALVSRPSCQRPAEQGQRWLFACMVPLLVGIFGLMFAPFSRREGPIVELIRDASAPAALRAAVGFLVSLPMLAAVRVLLSVRTPRPPGRWATALVQLLALVSGAAVVAESSFVMEEIRRHPLHHAALGWVGLGLVALIASFFAGGWRRLGLASAAMQLSLAPIAVQFLVSPMWSHEEPGPGVLGYLGALSWALGMGVAFVILPWVLPEERAAGGKPSTDGPAQPARAAHEPGHAAQAARTLAALLGGWAGALAAAAGLGAMASIALRDTLPREQAKDDAAGPIERLGDCASRASAQAQACCQRAAQALAALPPEERGRRTYDVLRHCLPAEVQAAAMHGSAAALEGASSRLIRSCRTPQEQPGHLDCMYLDALPRAGAAAAVAEIWPKMDHDAEAFGSALRVLRDHGDFSTLAQAAAKMPSITYDRASLHGTRASILGLLGQRPACLSAAQGALGQRDDRFSFQQELLVYPLVACGGDAASLGEPLLEKLRPGANVGMPEVRENLSALWRAYEAEVRGTRRGKGVSALEFLRQLDPPLRRRFVSSAARALAAGVAGGDLDEVATDLPDEPPGAAAAPPAPRAPFVLASPGWFDASDVLRVRKHETYGYSFPDDAQPPVDPSVAQKAAEALDAFARGARCGDAGCARREANARRLAWLLRAEAAAELLRRGRTTEAAAVLPSVEEGRPPGAPLLAPALWLAAGSPDRALRAANAELNAPRPSDPQRALHAAAVALAELGRWDEARTAADASWSALMRGPLPEVLAAAMPDPPPRSLRQRLLWMRVAAGIHQREPPSLGGEPAWGPSPCRRCPAEEWIELRDSMRSALRVWAAALGTDDQRAESREAMPYTELSTPALAYALGALASGDDQAEVWLSWVDAIARTTSDPGAVRMRMRARQAAARWRGDAPAEALWRERERQAEALVRDQPSALLAALLGL